MTTKIFLNLTKYFVTMMFFNFENDVVESYMECDCYLFSFILNSFIFSDSEIYNVFMYDVLPNGEEFKAIVHSLVYIYSMDIFVDVNGTFINEDEVIEMWEYYYNSNGFKFGKFALIPNHSSYNRYLSISEINSHAEEEINKTKEIVTDIMTRIYN